MAREDGSSEELPLALDYRQLFLDDVPLLDVRAPVEFKRGAFPNAVNAPLLNDAQREKVGIAYKQTGQQAAIELGHQLLSGERKTATVNKFSEFAKDNHNGVLYCFRGGLRSRISQRWLFEATGLRVPRVDGGYKAMRQFLLQEIEDAAARLQPIIIGGRTGVGKTVLLRELPRSLDLEALANHRGSAFGKHVTPQPSQIDFENAIAIALIKLRAEGDERIVVEDESRNVGSVNVPEALYSCFKRGLLLVVETELEERVDITFNEYIVEALAEQQRAARNDTPADDVSSAERRAFDVWAQSLVHNLQRIRRRLGPAKYERIHLQMCAAIEEHRAADGIDSHRIWIESLLRDYYDPMYDYQLKNKNVDIALAGPKPEIAQFIHHHLQHCR